MIITNDDVHIEFTDVIIPKGTCLRIIDCDSLSEYVCVHYNGYNYMIRKTELRGKYEN